MKKMNNKGFAISTLIYGLAIMGIMIVAILMATMAQTRSNNNSFAKAIEEELNRFSKTETSFKPIGDTVTAQEYIVPESGWYKIELWGSQGGGNGGYGAYTSGVIELEEGEVLYFYVGKHKNDSSIGGTETDVRLLNGEYTDELSFETRIMAAAGGGTSFDAVGGTLYGYNESMKSTGGYINAQESSSDFALIADTDITNMTNKTLIGLPKEYEISDVAPQEAGDNISSPLGSNGGGDGLPASFSAGTGGASYIVGYAGCLGISKGQFTIDPTYEYYPASYDPETNTTSYGNLEGTYYFVDGVMLPGVKDGDGFAKIQRVVKKSSNLSKLKRKNPKLDSVRYIKDCISDSTSSEDKEWSKIIAISNGIDRSSGKALQNTSTNCKTIDLGASYDLDEIVVFHKQTAGVDYENNVISVSNNNSNWTPIKNTGSGTNLSTTETVNGTRISAYQYDSTDKLPGSGTYIIIPVLSENKVVTASQSNATDNNPITIDYYKGLKNQKLSIETLEESGISSLGSYEYKIVESSRHKALSTNQNSVFATLSTPNKFNTNTRTESQIWKIEPIGNGTYTIRTAISPTSTTGMILAQTNQTISSSKDKIIIAKNNKDTARFKLISIDY